MCRFCGSVELLPASMSRQHHGIGYADENSSGDQEFSLCRAEVICKSIFRQSSQPPF